MNQTCQPPYFRLQVASYDLRINVTSKVIYVSRYFDKGDILEEKKIKFLKMKIMKIKERV